MYSALSGNIQWIICWIDRMSLRYGEIVREKETGKTWNWDQALCRGIYGPDWGNHPTLLEKSNGDGPNSDDIAFAARWENGEWPDWAEQTAPRKGREMMNYEDALKAYADAVATERAAQRMLDAAAQQEGFDIGKIKMG